MKAKPLAPLRRIRRQARGVALSLVGRLAFTGDAVECSCCGAHFRRFKDWGGPNRLCWNCSSLERHRAVALYLEQHPDMLRPGMSILHIAPEPTLRARFQSVPSVRYVAGDVDGQFGPERIDATDLHFPDASFDAVICNNVLEVIPDDTRAMRELRRVLKPGGWAMMLVGNLEHRLDVTTETVSDPAEKLRRFGDTEQVRRYGRDYPQRLAAAGFSADLLELEDLFGKPAVEHYRLKLDRFDAGPPLVIAH